MNKNGEEEKNENKIKTENQQEIYKYYELHSRNIQKSVELIIYMWV